jgi:hypothetical protein
MSAPSTSPGVDALDLSRWRNLPNVLIVAGGAGALLGLALNPRHFGFSWLVAFMFFLSLALGALFLVLVHHLFDAGWSVPIRRTCEHLAAGSFPWLAALFLPLAVLAPKVYDWMRVADPAGDHPLHAKWPLFTPVMFYVVAAFCFAAWVLLSRGLRFWSLQQDKTGAALCTYRMRRYAAVGIFFFAVTLTLAAVMWMKGLMYQWFSTMYGVYYFAASVWTTLATVYFITMVLKLKGTLRAVLFEHQFYFIGSLFFAFTVFYAYIHFSQYFIIWNANMPEETYWYVVRENRVWWYLGLVIVFGHFFLPFLALLRIDLKLTFWWMAPLCLWAWVMHWVDLSFNIMPALNPEGFAGPWIKWLWLDAACFVLIGGVLTKVFLRQFAAHPPYPIRDPRLIEAMGEHHPVASPISGGELDETDELADSGAEPAGGAR